MIPSVLSSQIRRGIEDYLRTTYPPEDPFFESILDDFLADEGKLFRGPFLSLKLPFRTGTGRAAALYPELSLKFASFLHQEAAFERLSAEPPRSTLIATGTGSGKTECFLYPLLDYCWKHRGEPGVKAILIYPMNALATDQARRFASEIYRHSALRGNVRAGLFIGGEPDSEGTRNMTADSVITCKKAMRENPPDILLTNYKMLDFLLLRPKDYAIFQQNSPKTLQYVVVDELHTFDGAQGTDLACLLRRLTFRLQTPEKHLCCIGTSATLGSGAEGKRKMAAFAEKLFGTPFGEDSIIGEDILKPGEFLGDVPLIKSYFVPGENELEELRAEHFATEQEYLKSQCRLWFGAEFSLPETEDAAARVELGNRLREHLFFQNLIRLLNQETVERSDLASTLDRILPGFSGRPAEFQAALLDSIFALISFARRQIVRNDGRSVLLPFLQVRIQLWLQEMRRMVATVENPPRLCYAADLRKEEHVHALPLIRCRDCGRVGYLSVMPHSANTLSADLDKIYRSFFSCGTTTQYIFPEQEGAPRNLFTRQLCGYCLNLADGDQLKTCPKCGRTGTLLQVSVLNRQKTASDGRKYPDKNCPFCESSESLNVIGSRSASLTSVAISQLFASQYNDDPKLLAFSDSVQDASHRAGFFSARTYRFNLRAAIQQFLEGETEMPTLAELPAKFIAFWREKLGGAARFAAQFIPSDMQWRSEYAELVERGKLDPASPFAELLRNRIHWEILSEYGYLSQIGRTLEKNGCSMIHLPPELRREWAGRIRQSVSESVGTLRDLTCLQVERFLVAFVRRLRIQGGIFAEYLQNYMQSGNPRALPEFLPLFGRGRAPVFPTLGGKKISRFPSLTGSKSTPTSYEKLLQRLWGAGVQGYSSELFQTILAIGVELEIVRKVSSSGGETSIYGLNPQKLKLEKSPRQFICDKTRACVAVPPSETELWQDMPSPRLDRNDAKLEPDRGNQKSYYGELYRCGRVHRVIAREHTGLLERANREKLEEKFISGEGLDAPNVLSCTPTLEMGINIGDLSAVFLCSVPPAQANYIQRIGRAGRRDGNAFNFVVAAQKPHDLHFFAEPLNMISGEVTPPGIFLNAPAVLERQLTAFCFDSWVKSIKGEAASVPEKLSEVLNAVGKKDLQKFPYPFLDYIELHRTSLLEKFFELFPEVFTEETRKHLANFMHDSRNDGLTRRILERLELLLKNRDSLKKKLSQVQKELSELRKKEHLADEALKNRKAELQIARKTLEKSRQAIDDKQTFNFFTDEGLLPNYAFPEAGVTLQSTIYWKRSKPDSSGSLYDASTQEYERAGKSAIQEFAPGNVFYVDGRKLPISRINLEGAVLERWHFCRDCQHVEKTTDEPPASYCPHCGSDSWKDASLTRNVLRLRQVIANLSEKESRSYDESDDRQPVFFNKLMLAEFSPEYIEKAYKIADENFPFGIEYLRKATFREINFGEQNADDSDTIEIASHKVSRRGFRVCEECGAVMPLKDGEPAKHAITCKYFGKPGADEFKECFYLYREFQSEALRLLLPLEDLDFDFHLHSFIAALYLGLKEQFEGNVDHLQVMLHEEPLPDSPMKKRFAVLYDQIPGGTGYLKQLAQSPDDFMNMLQAALEKLRSCPCQTEPEKDGCYRCLYAYRISNELPYISRKAAITLLERVLDERAHFQETDAIDKISVNPLFDSDLEKRFVEGLRRCSSEKVAIDLQKDIHDGRSAYRLTISQPGKERHVYKMVPQVPIGEQDEVAVCSKPDFVLYPLRKNSEIKPIAVFTDGFQFHADLTNGNYCFHHDLRKRMALVRSGNFLCWSLSFQDVMTKFDEEHENEPLCENTIFTQRASGLPEDLRDAAARNPFDALIALLSHPAAAEWQKAATCYAFSFSENGRQNDAVLQQWEERFLNDSVFYPAFLTAAPGGKAGYWNRTLANGGAKLDLLTTLASENCSSLSSLAKAHLVIRVHDADSGIRKQDFQTLWNRVLQAFNLLQFLPGCTIVTDRYVRENLTVPPQSAAASCECDEWAELRAVTDKAVHAILSRAEERNWAKPIPGYEIADAHGRVIASAELVWEEAQIAVFLDDAGQAEFSARNWKVFPAADPAILNLLESLLD